MTTKYLVDFRGWVAVNANTPEEAYDAAKRVFEYSGAAIMVEDVKVADY